MSVLFDVAKDVLAVMGGIALILGAVDFWLGGQR